jgi:hypothetical protein
MKRFKEVGKNTSRERLRPGPIKEDLRQLLSGGAYTKISAGRATSVTTERHEAIAEQLKDYLDVGWCLSFRNDGPR